MAKYLTLGGLAYFLEKIRSIFAPLVHTHTDKADKVSGATNGNFASLNSSGNLTDSGHSVDSFADASVYSKDGDGNAKITKPLSVNGSVNEGSPHGAVFEINVVVLTPEQKAEVEAATGTAYDYCNTNDAIEDGMNVTIYADEECTQKVGSTDKTEYADTPIEGDFFNLQNGESIAAGTYYARIERGVLGPNSHAEGNGTTASGDNSHAEGVGTTASGHNSHAEGVGTIASGDASHAEGNGTTASGGPSHAEGVDTTASGYASHAEGNSTVSSGDASHAEGSGTIASQANQHVCGKYNVDDTNGDYALIVGNGADTLNRSNAFAIDWNGNLVLFKADGTPVSLTPARLKQVIDHGEQITVASSVSSQALSPNTLYVFSERTTNLTLTLGSAISGIANEYHLFLTIGSSVPTITWPSGISWNGGSAPTIAANKTYEVSIMNNIATFIEV